MSKKICIVFSTIILIALTLIYIITYNAYSKKIKESAVALMNQAAVTTATLLDNTFSTAKIITLAPSFSANISESFKNRYSFNGASGNDSRFLFYFLSSLPNSSGSIVFFSTDGTILYFKAPMTAHAYITSKYDEWRDISNRKSGESVLTAVDAESGFSAAVLRSVVNIDSLESLGLGVVLLSSDDFSKAFSQISGVPGIRAVVVDAENKVIYDSASTTQNYNISEDEILRQLADQRGTYEIKASGETYIGNNYKASQYGVMIFSKESELLKSMKDTQLMLLIIAVVILISTVLMILFMSDNLTHPLRKITTMIKCVQNGDFSVRFNNQTHDEIGVLGENINILLETLNKQMDDIIAINTRKNAIEVDVLRSQINPHFIYNTLETIHMMAIESNQPDIEKISMVFGRLIRYNISKLNELTTLGREIEYLQDYVYIQNERFEDQYNLIAEVPENLRSCRIIKLLIQPLVENSISHGYAHVRETGNILLKCRDEDGSLYISVEDEGEGISEEKMQNLLKDLENTDAIDTDRNIGLRNVNSRIKLYYGEMYGLRISLRPGGGVKAEISIPISY